MIASPELLDTSALVSFIENEEGADRVEVLLERPGTLIAWVSLLEVFYISIQEHGQAVAEERQQLIKALPVTILWDNSEAVLREAGLIKARYKVSFADSIIAAYAIIFKATLVHKDPEYEQLSSAVSMERLPYK